MTFRESGLVFEFPSSHWVVKPFDRHPFYKVLSGQGFKGVDFIGLHNDEELVCMEVKNYRRSVLTTESEWLAFLESERRVVEHKMEDTLQILELINQYYRRKSFFRLLNPLFSRFPAFFSEWGFWSRAKDLSENLDKCRFVWWVDTDSSTEEDFWQKLPESFPELRLPLTVCRPTRPNPLNIKVFVEET